MQLHLSGFLCKHGGLKFLSSAFSAADLCVSGSEDQIYNIILILYSDRIHK